jgi:hypothetical protein
MTIVIGVGRPTFSWPDEACYLSVRCKRGLLWLGALISSILAFFAAGQGYKRIVKVIAEAAKDCTPTALAPKLACNANDLIWDSPGRESLDPLAMHL